MTVAPAMLPADYSRLAYNNLDGYADLVAPEASKDAAAERADANGEGLFRDGAPSFDDILDLLNPLHHIPVVSTLYRAVTGDTISAGVRLAGGALFGGPLGFVSALANTIMEEATGKDIGDRMLALAGVEVDPAPPSAPPTQVASLQAASPQAATTPAPAVPTGAASGAERMAPPREAGPSDRDLVATIVAANRQLAQRRAFAEPLPLPPGILERSRAAGDPRGPGEPSAAELAQRLVLYTQARQANAAGADGQAGAIEPF